MARRFPFATFAALLEPGPQRDRFAEFAKAARLSTMNHIAFETDRVARGLAPRPAPPRHRASGMLARCA